MQSIPYFVQIIFAAVVVFVIVSFYAASGSRVFLKVVIAWVLIQSLIALSGFYTITHTTPPRIMLAILPAFMAVLMLFTTYTGKQFVNSLNLKTLALMHSIRMVVELVLYWLFLAQAMPQLMTFEGRNFDIIPAVTAPLIWYFGFVKKQLSHKLIIGWNIASIMILAFTVINGILSAPTVLQQFAFDQPAIAVLYFPFILLPTVVVPLVMVAHIATIRRFASHKSSSALSAG